jgi:hypothetical protein
MYKIIIAILLSSVVGAGLNIGYLNWKEKPSTVSTFPEAKIKDLEIAQSLGILNKFVIISPQAQMWIFSPEQKIESKTIQQNKTELGYVIYSQITASTSVQLEAEEPAKPEVPATPNKSVLPKETKPQVINISLSGVAKLNYEYYANEFHLVSVESVSLKASQDK